MAPQPEREADGDVGLDMDRKEELIMAKRLRACRVTILPKGPGVSRSYLPEAPQQPVARRVAQPVIKKVAGPSPAAMAAASNPIALRYWSQCLALTAPRPPAVEDPPPPPPRHDELPPWATPDAPAPPSPPAPAPSTVPDMGRRVGREAGTGKWGPGARTDWGAVLREEEEGRAPLPKGARPWGQQLKTQAEESTGKHPQTTSFHDQRISTVKKVDKLKSSTIQENISKSFNSKEMLAIPNNIKESNETSPSAQMHGFPTNSKSVSHYRLYTTQGDLMDSNGMKKVNKLESSTIQQTPSNGLNSEKLATPNNVQLSYQTFQASQTRGFQMASQHALSSTKGDIIESVTQEHKENYLKTTEIKAENIPLCSTVSLDTVQSVPAESQLRATAAAPPHATIETVKGPDSEKRCVCSHGISCLPSLSAEELARALAVSRPQVGRCDGYRWVRMNWNGSG